MYQFRFSTACSFGFFAFFFDFSFFVFFLLLVLNWLFIHNIIRYFLLLWILLPACPFLESSILIHEFLICFDSSIKFFLLSWWSKLELLFYFFWEKLYNSLRSFACSYTVAMNFMRKCFTTRCKNSNKVSIFELVWPLPDCSFNCIQLVESAIFIKFIQ